jgi:hypothetical protein
MGDGEGIEAFFDYNAGGGHLQIAKRWLEGYKHLRKQSTKYDAVVPN